MPGYAPFALIVAVASLLAACGSAADDPGLNQTRPPQGYADYQTQAAQLSAAWSGTPFTDPATLPSSGTADFAGVLDIAVENGGNELALAGAMSLRATFATNAINGDARAFYDAQNRGYGGKLLLSNGVIDRGADPTVGYTFGADIDGTLTAPSGNVSVAAYLNGDFLGAQHLGAEGVVAGTSLTNAGAGYAFGSFTVEQP